MIGLVPLLVGCSLIENPDHALLLPSPSDNRTLKVSSSHSVSTRVLHTNLRLSYFALCYDLIFLQDANITSQGCRGASRRDGLPAAPA